MTIHRSLAFTACIAITAAGICGARAESLSQSIRSKTEHYWKYMKKDADLSGVESLLKFEGIIAGDPHMGNFGVIPVESTGGRASMKYLAIDFDDAGRGPFILDFIRLEVAAEAAKNDIKKSDLEKAYIRGLQGTQIRPPAEVNGYLAMTVAEYDKKEDELVDSRTKGDSFKLKPGKLEKDDGKISRSAIESALDGVKVLDVAIRPVERGGSRDQKRIWVLVREGGKKRIIELKEYRRTTLAHYQQQPALRTWLAEVHETFWPGLDSSTYTIIDIKGGGEFWIRPKRVPLIDIPYSSDKAKKVRYLKELAELSANALGLVHGRQREGAAYLKAILKDEGAFHEATKAIVGKYLKVAEKELRK